MKNPAPTLYVDLDGSLIRSDMLLESLMGLLRHQLLAVVLIPFWLLKGRANLKAELAKRYTFDPANLPYNPEVLNIVQGEKRTGREVILATAADQSIAKKIANHLNCFSDVLASSESRNLKGKKKLEAIVERQQGNAFSYIGNSTADFPIWEAAQEKILVATSASLGKRIKKTVGIDRTIGEPNSLFHALLRALRPHQAAKNALLFVGLITAHQLNNPEKLIPAILAFISFCFCASAVYLINDLVDLPADRVHPSKKNRPFAAGTLPLHIGLLLSPVLLAAAFLLSCTVTTAFQASLLGYFVCTLLYSFLLKQVPILDVIMLAGLYTLRIIAGGLATNIAISQWLFLFSMFFFFSLASAKRYAELHARAKREETEKNARGYYASDLPIILQLGASSGLLSILVFALYLNSSTVDTLYTYPVVIWLILPVLLFWIARIWLLTSRGQMHEDPVIFALRDKTSYVAGLMAGMLIWIAI